MLHGDRIINGILSLIYLEPCHFLKVSLEWEEAYRARPGWHSFLGFYTAFVVTISS